MKVAQTPSWTDWPCELRHLVLLACLGFCFVLKPATSVFGQVSSNQVLRFAAEVRRLTPEQAEKHLLVRLRGVVTYHDEALYSRFVQDETAGIYFQELTNGTAFQAGQLVEIEGETGAGEYAPVVIPKSLKVLGEGKMPAAKTVSLEELVSGGEDSQFVEVVGTVRAVRFEEESQNYLIDLVTGGERFTAYARQLPVTNAEDLVESVIRLRGVCSTLFNRQRQLFGFRLLVPRVTDLVVEKHAAADPFDIPAQTISSLLRFTAQGTFGRRVKVVGRVVYQEPGVAVFIQDEKEGLYCQSRERRPVETGDTVEVLGFPAKGEYTPILQDATYRKIGSGAAPRPANINLDEALSGTYDCRLVRITANLLEHTKRGREQFIVLEKEGFIFYAYLAQETGGPGFSPAQTGSEVAVVGICLIERGSSWRAGESWRAKGFRILLRSPQDVVIVRSPPWLSVGKVLWMAGALGFIALAVSGWVAVLHRQVAERTHQLETQVHERQRAERRHVIEQERTRVAQDLHDELGATITELGMLSSLARTPSLPPESRERYLDQLSGVSRSLVTVLDEIVWAVNPKYDSVASLASYYSLFAQRFLNLAGMACRLRIADALPATALDSRLRHGVFLAFKEALNNAVHHSGGSEVQIEIDIVEKQLKIVVSDNGKGFASTDTPPGSDGLASMKERMTKLGGQCQITTKPGMGTTVEFRLPLSQTVL